MTTYTAIPNADIDTDSPLTQSLMTLVRDNPIALAEGASGAPRIQRAAIKAGVGHRWFFDYGDESDLAQAWTTAGSGYAPGLWQCTTFSIAAGQVATLSSMGPLIICATTSIIINGTLDVDGQGARGGLGDTSAVNISGQPGMFGGGGGAANTSGIEYGGGTYMTAGGAPVGGNGSAQSARTKATLLSQMPIFDAFGGFRSYANNAGTLFTYGLANQSDAAVGGGGGSGQNSSGQHGGQGGGLVVLCAPIVTVGAAGVVTADGTAPATGTNAGGGGGGAIIIATPAGGYTLTAGGSVAASAGLSGGTGGDGGAGWVEAITLT